MKNKEYDVTNFSNPNLSKDTNSMNPAVLIILTVVELLLKYGAPAVVKIISDWNVQDPTVEDFLALNELLKDPETYFKKE